MPIPPVPDTEHVDVFTPGLGYRQGKLVARGGPVRAVIVHTTGGGILARFRREGAAKGDADPFDTAVRVYTKIMVDSGHYVVGQRLGQIAQVVPESHVARHVGSAGSVPYLRTSPWYPGREAARYAWWHDRWQGYDSPRDLAGGHLWDVGQAVPGRIAKASCNAQTIALEVVPPLEGATREWSPECWQNIANLIPDITDRHGLPLARSYVVTHSDAHPLSRTTPKGEPWDTAPSQWTWERFSAAVSA